MKKERILILLIGLLFAMPMFAQKLNSRGEKMVKAVKCHKHGESGIINVISFSYNENDEIVALKATSTHDKHTYVAGIKDGQVYTEVLQGNEKMPELDCLASITTNSEGNIGSYIKGSSDGESYSFDEYTFYYITDPTINAPTVTRKLRLSRCSASAFGDNDGASYNYVPTEENETKRLRKTEIRDEYYGLYKIENGYTVYIEADDQWNESRKYISPITSRQVNDMNINLYGILENCFRNSICTCILLYCSPWLPFACKYLPLADGYGFQYAYAEKKGNIITIRKLMGCGKDRKMLKETGDYIEIEYVED